MNKIIIIYITFFLSLNVYAIDLKYKNSLICIINNEMILESQIKKQVALSSMLTPPTKKINNSKSFVLNKIINSKIQLNIAKSSEIQASEDEMKNVYMKLIIRDKTSLSEYLNDLKKYNLTTTDVKTFIKNIISIEKLHESLLYDQIRISYKEFNKALKYSNNILIKNDNNDYEIIRFSIKKNDKLNTDDIKNILTILNEKRNYNKITKLLSNKTIDTTFAKININTKNIINKKIYSHLKSNIDLKILGPIYSDKNIDFLKITRKKTQNINIKIKHSFIEKSNNKKTYLDKNIEKLDIMKTLLSNKNLNKNLTIEWINKKNVSKSFFKKIKNLKKNESSDIFETEIGFHIVKIIDVKYIPNTRTYKQSFLEFKNKKLLNLRKNWVKAVRKDHFVHILNESK